MHVFLQQILRVACPESIFPSLLRESHFCLGQKSAFLKHASTNTCLTQFCHGTYIWPVRLSGRILGQAFCFLLIETDSGTWVFAPLHISPFSLEVTQPFWDFGNKCHMLGCCEQEARQSLHPPGIIRAAVPALSCQTLPFVFRRE